MTPIYPGYIHLLSISRGGTAYDPMQLCCYSAARGAHQDQSKLRAVVYDSVELAPLVLRQIENRS